jgi:hypothetical protein
LERRRGIVLKPAVQYRGAPGLADVVLGRQQFAQRNHTDIGASVISLSVEGRGQRARRAEPLPVGETGGGKGKGGGRRGGSPGLHKPTGCGRPGKRRPESERPLPAPGAEPFSEVGYLLDY